MTVLPFAAIHTSIPDDSIENEDGSEIIHFGGEPVANIVREILMRPGYRVAAPVYLEDAGWEVNVRDEGRQICIRDQTFGDGLNVVGTTDKAMLRDLPRLRTSYEKVLQQLDSGLREDSRVLQLDWYAEFDEAVDSARPEA